MTVGGRYSWLDCYLDISNHNSGQTYTVQQVQRTLQNCYSLQQSTYDMSAKFQEQDPLKKGRIPGVSSYVLTASLFDFALGVKEEMTAATQNPNARF
jgi:hypothetical protein